MDPITRKVGLVIAPDPPANRPRSTRVPAYAREILRHAGFWLEEPPDLAAATECGVRVVVLVGDGAATEDEARRAAAWVEAGGALVAVGSTWGMPNLFGVEHPAASGGFGLGPCLLGEGYVAPADRGHPLVHGLRSALHTFGGVAVRAAGADAVAGVLDAHGRPTDLCAIAVHGHGSGLAVFLAPDIPGSVEHIQTGRWVERDGVPSPDHSSPLSDQVLKADDGLVLDWLLDRAAVAGCPHPVFAHAVADELRELLVRAVLFGGIHAGAPLTVLWHWPHDMPAVGLISHDSDGNDGELACRLLGLTRDLGVTATWCVQPPGYPADVTAAIRDDGHELALHFDAFEQGGSAPWTRSELVRQHAWAEAALGQRVTGNKNHYTRWEGRLDFLRWCAETGITCDQSRGPSKPGGAGFPFGTCHPYWACEADGTPIDCLELGFMSQDPVVYLPRDALGVLLDTVEERHGVAHVIFHPAHCGNTEVNDAMAWFVRECRERGMGFMRACDIEAWERSRRETRLEAGCDGAVVVSDTVMRGATTLVLSPREAAVRRWSFPFRAAVGDLGPHANLALPPEPHGGEQ